MPLISAGWQPEKLNPRAASLADGPVTPKALQGAALAVFGCPTRAFTAKEIAALHAFVDQVGCSVVLLQRACRHCGHCKCMPRHSQLHHPESNALSVAITVLLGVCCAQMPHVLKLTSLLDAAAIGSQAGQTDICMSRLQGGALAVFGCAADSSDADVSANLNALLGRYGITVDRDALFSIVQQVLLIDGIATQCGSFSR